jgi:hypothetical protein
MQRNRISLLRTLPKVVELRNFAAALQGLTTVQR